MRRARARRTAAASLRSCRTINRTGVVVSLAGNKMAATPDGAARPECEPDALLCVGDRELRLRLVEELLVFGRSLERGGRGPCALDRLRHRVEVAGTHLALVLDRGEALGDRRELRFLQLHERCHLAASVAMRQIEHAVVQTVEAGEGDELELVAHRAH